MTSTITPDAAQQIAVNSGIQGVMPQAADAVHIISIFPFERVHELQLGSFKETPDGPVAMAGFRPFRIEPAPRSGYRILRVEGGLKWLMNYSNVGPDQEAPEIGPIWQSAEIIANSLVIDWTRHTLGTSGIPGIEILTPENMKHENGVPLIDKEGLPVPTNSYIAKLNASQTVYAQGCITRATDLHTQGKASDITDLDRGMAAWLYGTGATRLPWFPKQEFRSLKECPNCGEEILESALGCRHCSVNLPEFYIKMHIDPARDPVVAAAVTRMLEAETSTAKGNPAAALDSDIAAIEAKTESSRTRTERDKLREYRNRAKK